MVDIAYMWLQITHQGGGAAGSCLQAPSDCPRPGGGKPRPKGPAWPVHHELPAGDGGQPLPPGAAGEGEAGHHPLPGRRLVP